MSVKLIIDSASDILKSYADEKDLIFLPLKTQIDQEEYLDGITLSHKAFYEKLETCKTLPTTSQIPPFDYLETFKKIQQNNDEAVVIAISSKLSGTFQSAVTAMEEYKNNIYIVDSESVSIGERILIEYAIRLRDEGASAKQIAEKLDQAKHRICLFALFDTLEYLMKGGRISKATAFAGGVLKIKPVIGAENGELIMLGKARGAKKSNNFLNAIIEKKGGIDFSMPYMIAYTGLNDMFSKDYIENSHHIWGDRLENFPISTIGSTVGTHAGPGALAIAFFINQK